jgi:tRNA (guanine37-N1)-methyltransferase
LQPGVLNDEGSHQMDSFNPALDGLLDCGHFTRPEVWNQEGVPAVLMSGHHADIAQWRREQSLGLTLKVRPELIEAARSAGKLSPKDEHFLTHFKGNP